MPAVLMDHLMEISCTRPSAFPAATFTLTKKKKRQNGNSKKLLANLY